MPSLARNDLIPEASPILDKRQIPVLRHSLGLTGSALMLGSSQTLKGAGAVSGIVGGSGLVSPGNSPGILAATAIDPAGALDFSFEMTALNDPTWSNASASLNDVLRLSDAANPFASGLDSDNTVTVNFAIALNIGDVIRGGFYTDKNSDFTLFEDNADWQYTFTGGSLPGGANVVRSVTQVSVADFSSGAVNDGWVTTFTIVPEPSAIVIASMGVIGVAVMRARRRD